MPVIKEQKAAGLPLAAKGLETKLEASWRFCDNLTMAVSLVYHKKEVADRDTGKGTDRCSSAGRPLSI
jgi:hypothetical protein